MRYTWLIWVMIVVAGIGLADASYLTIEHLQYGEVNCSFFGGCDIVTGSEYGQVGPMPTSAFGIVYYGGLLTAFVVGLRRRSERIIRWAALATIAGLLTSVALVYIMIEVLRAICIFCLASAVTSTLLFVLGMTLTVLLRKPPQLMRIEKDGLQ